MGSFHGELLNNQMVTPVIQLFRCWIFHETHPAIAVPPAMKPPFPPTLLPPNGKKHMIYTRKTMETPVII